MQADAIIILVSDPQHPAAGFVLQESKADGEANGLL